MRVPQRLQWRLTLSYTLITIITVLLVELLTVLVVLGYFLFNQTTLQVTSLHSQAIQAFPYFVHGDPDRAELTAWLSISEKQVGPQVNGPNGQPRGFLSVIDTHSVVLASVGEGAPAPALPLAVPDSAFSHAQLEQLLQGRRSALTYDESGSMQLQVVPIQADGQRPVGALVALVPRLGLSNILSNYGRLGAIVGINLVLLTFLIGLVGTLFGFLTARSFTRRFTRLAQAADHWSSGDFSQLIRDPAPDEIGQLARRMDRMAEQLQQLLRTRQQLASVEERNRLARDLHDSVKQQIFSVAMQLGTLRALMTRDTEKAQRRLAEVEKTVKLAQQELTALIRELRPAALEDRSLIQALQDLVAQWMQQTWISASVEIEYSEDVKSVEGKERDKLPVEIEDAFFRIVQEALSNVARHSNATQVHVQLQIVAEDVTLTITDNGRGFSATQSTLQSHSGVGLRSIQERIQALHGVSKIKSSEGEGTRIQVSCPCSLKQEVL
ncbi:HAMP domain-containing proteinhypothetical protein [Ktedonobacteria bacterium brp13]|nr:HAMP domain-containing proteinhypothetical protein [Ktedonobacteria bacterium brp13]